VFADEGMKLIKNYPQSFKAEDIAAW